MKKLMIAVCAIAISAISQAASINWSAAAANPGMDPAYNQYVYLLHGDSDKALATTITLSALTDVGADVIGSVADNGFTVVAAYKLNNDDAEGGSFLSTFTRTDKDGGVNGYYQIILADADNKTFAIEKFADAVSGVTDSTGAGAISFNADWSGDEYVGANGFTGEFTAAPEPTSGLLLLLGVAGLALKRKRA